MATAMKRTIYDVLKDDHDELRPLLAQLVLETEINSDVKNLLKQIEKLLVPHARAEEAILYNALREMGSEKAREEARHGYKDHMMAETLLRTLQGLSVVGIEWTRAFKKLRESLEHHIEEEETEVFESARQILSPSEAESLAEAFEKLKQEYESQGSMKNSIEMIANLMPGRFKDTYREYVNRL
jgi:hemerythrin superfamily protein